MSTFILSLLLTAKSQKPFFFSLEILLTYKYAYLDVFKVHFLTRLFPICQSHLMKACLLHQIFLKQQLSFSSRSVVVVSEKKYMYPNLLLPKNTC